MHSALRALIQVHILIVIIKCVHRKFFIESNEYILVTLFVSFEIYLYIAAAAVDIIFFYFFWSRSHRSLCQNVNFLWVAIRLE